MKSSFGVENIIIPAEVQEYFNANFKDKPYPQLDNYKLSIIAPIGAGKSSALSAIEVLFQTITTVITIPEYLQSEPEFGSIMLSKFIEGTISNFSMQSNIIDIYRNSIIKNGNTSSMTLLERCPDDSLVAFGVPAYRSSRHDIGDSELLLLYNKTKQLDEEFNLPSYFLGNYSFKRIASSDFATTLLIILHTIKYDLSKNIQNRIIGLDATFDVCKIRIKRRGRVCEEKYSDEYIQRCVDIYSNIFKFLETNSPMNFISLGRL